MNDSVQWWDWLIKTSDDQVVDKLMEQDNQIFQLQAQIADLEKRLEAWRTVRNQIPQWSWRAEFGYDIWFSKELILKLKSLEEL